MDAAIVKRWIGLELNGTLAKMETLASFGGAQHATTPDLLIAANVVARTMGPSPVQHYCTIHDNTRVGANDKWLDFIAPTLAASRSAMGHSTRD